ncbi:DUF4333 domain-containing protein [Amycolatopsis sp. cmx-8-4]|uniref:DUF4333 domain-containing protein n=1 Tax=Amycolatopsis sp. cmx-8-4 TaxID=2790947 RepID=UPI00397C653C
MTRRFLAFVGLCCVLAGCTASVSAPVLPSRGTPVPTSAPVKVLDPAAVRDGVRKILVESFHIADVGGVTCPVGQPVSTGRAFACTAEIGRTAKRVPITVLDADGRYRVDPPG